MKMILAVLLSELCSKMRHGFTTFKNAEQTMEAPWLTPPKNFNRVHLAGKVMALIFWDSQRVIMINYLEQGCTINVAYYAGEWRWLRQEIARKRRGN